ncbi:MAG: calcium/sodium antiporter [Acholeplasmataceae bacterium]|jgi:cation:H+ antiporter|nr:calcium/sodium antiporter [Acholeplasmataceae bacterium]
MFLDILLNLVFLIVGFVFLIKGADLFIVSSSSIARKFNVSPLVIGLTLVAFGTSLPELAVSVAASISAKQAGTTADIAMGNVIGSNIANITLILGLSAIMMPIAVKKSMRKQEFPFLILTTLLIALFAFVFADQAIVWWEALILLGFFAYYMRLMFKSPNDHVQEDEIKVVDMKKAILLLIIGLVGVTLGGTLVTRGAEFISTEILKSFMTATRATTLVGLSVVALGTSLPELVTSVMAAKKGENEIALGNIVGSNVFNTLLIVGFAGVITPLKMNDDVLMDIIILIFITITMVIFSFTKHTISKKEGYILFGIYISYIVFIIIRALGLF